MVESKRLRNKVRMSYAVSTVSIAMVLFLLGSVGWMIGGLIGATDRMRENVEVSVMLGEGVDDTEREAVGKDLKAFEGVREVVFVGKDEAAREFISSTGDDFTEFLDFNPLPDSFLVRMEAEGSVEALEQAAKEWDGVDEVVYQHAVVEQIGANVGKFQLALLVFGGVLLIISVVLLNNTIRVSVYAKRHIINTMKLVGATRGFIMRPFVTGSVVQGLWAAVIGASMFVLLTRGLGEELPAVTSVATPMPWIIGGMLVAGVAISVVFTSLAVGKFARMSTNSIHMY